MGPVSTKHTQTRHASMLYFRQSWEQMKSPLYVRMLAIAMLLLFALSPCNI